MASSTKKGNISNFMIIIAFSALIILLVIIAQMMLPNGIRAGKYNNPSVARQVIRGTIYDRNGRALAMDVPQQNLYVSTNSDNNALIAEILSLYLNTTPSVILSKLANSRDSEVLIQEGLNSDVANTILEQAIKNNLSDSIKIIKEYSRVYPSTFHAAQLIQETEQVASNLLDPIPGFDELTTYGRDVYLTIDLDIQYLLDLTVQQVYELQNPSYSIGFVLDIKTGDVLADTCYPFYDLNDSSGIPASVKINRALISNISKPEIRIENINIIDKVTLHNGTVDNFYTLDKAFITDLEDIDNPNSILAKIPEENPKYLVFISSSEPKYYQVSSVLEYAISTLEEGLASQGKL
ncbi:MAG: hypothetical protein HUK23_07370 [Sphaerochaetaceae bacterium]|nr:hypothetical protein [Sphaerochaetaceae bacterium]